MQGGDLAEDRRPAVQQALDRVADEVESRLGQLGLPPHTSILFRPFNVAIAVDAEKIIAVFSRLTGGMADVKWIDRTGELVTPEGLVAAVRQQLGHEPEGILTLPRQAADEESDVGVAEAATRHVADVERAYRLARVPEAGDFLHLEPFLREFLDHHPDPQRSVFIMMTFLQTEQMESIHQTIRNTVTERGLDPIRADDRDYTGELWSNVEVCMLGCKLGIAVIEEQTFNPNVALELGWMLARRRRCLILKERRLPTLPADIIGRLYKPFDAFDIETTVRARVLEWLTVDLGL